MNLATPTLYDTLSGKLSRLNGHVAVVPIGNSVNGMGVSQIMAEAAARQPAPYCGRLGRMYSHRGNYRQACGEAVAALLRECGDIPAVAAINTILRHLAPKKDDGSSGSATGRGEGLCHCLPGWGSSGFSRHSFCSGSSFCSHWCFGSSRGGRGSFSSGCFYSRGRRSSLGNGRHRQGG